MSGHVRVRVILVVMCEHLRCHVRTCEMSCENMEDVMREHVRCHVRTCEMSCENM